MLRIYSGVISGIGLWTAFIINLLILGLAMWAESGLLVVLSITLSVLILVDQIRVRRIGDERSLNNRRLFVRLHEDRFSGNLHWAEPDKILGYTFSEMFLKAGRRKKGLRIGSRQCQHPLWTSVCNIEIPLEYKPAYGFLRDMGMASWTSGFSCSVDKVHLTEARHGNNWLRLSISDNDAMLELFDKEEILTQTCVKAVEICPAKLFAEDKDRNTESRLLEFLKELRQLSGGKPTGFRLTMQSEDYVKRLCRKIWEYNIIPDFIIIDYSREKDALIGEVYRYLSLIDRELEGIGLRDQVRVLVSCRGCYIHQLIRMRHCGADAFMIVSPGQANSLIGCDDYSRSCFSVLVHRHRQWIHELFGSEYETATTEEIYAATETSLGTREFAAASVDTNCKNVLKKFIYHFN